MLLLWLLLTSVIVLLIAAYQHHYGYWKRRGIVGPRAVPFFGNLFEYVIARKHYGDIYGDIYKKYPNANYVGVYKMSTPSLLVRNLDLVHNILSRNFASFEENDFSVNKELDPLVSENPFVKTGDEWKQGRSIISPMLTISKVKAMFPALKNTCEKLSLYLSTCVEQEFEAKELFYKYVVENIAICAFGLDAGTFDDAHAEFLVMSTSVFQPNLLLNLAVLFLPSLLKPLRVTFVAPKVDKWLRSIVNQVMKQRRDTNAQRNDFLQAIMSHSSSSSTGNGKELSEDAIVGNCLMFLTEGSETSAITLTYVFYELARNPEEQQKLFEEVTSAGEMTAESLGNMKYLEQVIYETLRMHSAVFSITRICGSPLEINGQFSDSSKGLLIERGTKIIIPVQDIQMDPENFENPETFNPSRFSKENSENIRKMSYLAFGEGPRLCVGKVFGIFQVKAAIVTILSKYRVELSDKMTEKPKQSPTSFLRNDDAGIWIKLIPRK